MDIQCMVTFTEKERPHVRDYISSQFYDDREVVEAFNDRQTFPVQTVIANNEPAWGFRLQYGENPHQYALFDFDDMLAHLHEKRVRLEVTKGIEATSAINVDI